MGGCDRGIGIGAFDREMSGSLPELGVNIDHVATVRNARGGFDPDPLSAAVMVRKAGASQIVCHLREDRRHIKDQDLRLLKQWNGLPVNLEMAMTDEMATIALDVSPDLVTLVPERREERTTEGGLVLGAEMRDRIRNFLPACHQKGIRLSIFLAPVKEDVDVAISLGVDQVELHTGEYANARTPVARRMELERLKSAALRMTGSPVRIAAGHGLDLLNLPPVLEIGDLQEVNIGHSIISRGLFVGLENAVREFLAVIGERPECSGQERIR